MTRRFSFALLTMGLLLAAATLIHAEAALKIGDWPRWRGPFLDGVSRETGLVKDWPKDGPPVVWRVDSVGVGYSSLAIQNGRIYTQGDLNGIEHVICLSAKDGSVIWAVQPEPAKLALDELVNKEMQRTDRNGDGQVDESEALARIGWRFNKFDQPAKGDAGKIAAARAADLVKQLDKDGDGRLTFAEAGNAFGDSFTDIDRADQGVDARALAAKRAAQVLALLDKDKDANVSKKEAGGTVIDRSFNRIDRKPEGEKKGDELLTAQELTGYFARFEPGRDGVLDVDELSAYYADRFPGADGKLSKLELRGYFGGLRDGQGDGPRGTPTIEGDRLWVEGGMGDVTCLDTATGKTIWHVHLAQDLHGNRPGWGYSESPLIEGDMVIVTPGGKDGTLAALDKSTGKVIWRSEGHTEGAGYASPVAANIAGVRQIVQFASRNLFGVDARDGKVLWTYDHANNGTANCATAVVYGDHVFASSSYGTGGGLVHIRRSGDGFKADEVYFSKELANHHGGIVLVGEHMYGFGNGGLICMHMLSGKIAWTAGSVGKGSLVAADGMLYLLGEGHQMALAEANPRQYAEHGRFKLDGFGRPSWAHPVVAGGRLYLRDQHQLTAYDIAAKP